MDEKILVSQLLEIAKSLTAGSLMDKPNMANGEKYIKTDFDDLIYCYKRLKESIEDYEGYEGKSVENSINLANKEAKKNIVKDDIYGFINGLEKAEQHLQMWQRILKTYVLPEVK